MIGKKDTLDIFNQYKTILLEQIQTKSFESFIDRIRAANFDQRLKDEILELFGNPMVENAYNILHKVGDADTAGYASYPEAQPAMDQDDQDTVNDEDRDSSFADEMRKAQKEQQEKYSEQPPYAEEDEENGAKDLIKKDLDAAIAAGDQKRASELFDELRNFGKLKPIRSSSNSGTSTQKTVASNSIDNSRYQRALGNWGKNF
jgi:hypothetical protein